MTGRAGFTLLGLPHADDLKESLRLPARGRLLDAGGGTGRASFPLRPHVDAVVAGLSPAIRRSCRFRSWIMADKPS
ncbi:MAG: hypothetical protein KJ936_07865 [Proteobacteria bacterium]|nr:hypothetical protein [Pseudomonadota bacterium]MBU2227567.1 hypothetical protein [Pseudomonadota bacterium]